MFASVLHMCTTDEHTRYRHPIYQLRRICYEEYADGSHGSGYRSDVQRTFLRRRREVGEERREEGRLRRYVRGGEEGREKDGWQVGTTEVVYLTKPAARKRFCRGL